MSYPYPIPATPRVISPSPTPSEVSDKQESYFPPTTRSNTRDQRHKSPEPISEEKDGSGSDSSVEKRARARSRSPIYTNSSQLNGTATTSKRRRMSGLTPVTKSEPLTNGNLLPIQSSAHLSPYSQLKKSWREFSRSPSPLGLIPLHRHYRTLIHKHEIPRKILHVSIGFATLYLYSTGIQRLQITPPLLVALIPIAAIDIIRHRWPTMNSYYIKVCGALMRETEVDGYNGVIWYLLGAFTALNFFPKDVGVMSVLLLSWCDTAASTFGRLYGRYTIRLRKGKSLAGSLAAFAVGAFTAAMFWGWFAPRIGTFPDDPPNAFMYTGCLALPQQATRFLGWQDGSAVVHGAPALAIMSTITGLVASVSEVIDLFGWDDNLTIPVLSSLGLFGFLRVFG